jgi:hypothetical protein
VYLELCKHGFDNIFVYFDNKLLIFDNIIGFIDNKIAIFDNKNDHPPHNTPVDTTNTSTSVPSIADFD